jgi:multisubunit Na+/H+ antiporter MnhG subunit
MKQNDQRANMPMLLTTVVSQVGCVSVLIIGLALGAGLLLNQFLGTQIFTVLFILGSFPIVLYMTMRIATRAQHKLTETPSTEEENKV